MNLSLISKYDFFKMSVFCDNLFHSCPQMYFHTQAVHLPLQPADHVRRMIRHREHTVAALNLCRHTDSFKEINHLLIRVAIKTTV